MIWFSVGCRCSSHKSLTKIDTKKLFSWDLLNTDSQTSLQKLIETLELLLQMSEVKKTWIQRNRSKPCPSYVMGRCTRLAEHDSFSFVHAWKIVSYVWLLFILIWFIIISKWQPFLVIKSKYQYGKLSLLLKTWQKVFVIR